MSLLFLPGELKFSFVPFAKTVFRITLLYTQCRSLNMPVHMEQLEIRTTFEVLTEVLL